MLTRLTVATLGVFLAGGLGATGNPQAGKTDEKNKAPAAGAQALPASPVAKDSASSKANPERAQKKQDEFEKENAASRAGAAGSGQNMKTSTAQAPPAQ